MDRVFLQGPLADARLLVALLGAAPETEAAALSGWRLGGGKTPIPGLIADPEGQVAGLRLRPTEAQLLRLNDFAAVLGLAPMPLGDAGRAYLPADATDAPWHPGAAPGWAAILTPAVAELVGYLEAGLTPDRLRPLWPQIMMRGVAKANAQAAPAKPGASGLGLEDVTIERLQRPYCNYFAVEELRYRHRAFGGGEVPTVERAVFMAADAATVLPYDPVRDRVLVIEQLRAGAVARQDPAPWILEPVAGRIEPGDTPEETAHKEAAEEAGLSLRELIFSGDYYPSAGCFSEFLITYIGLADLPDEAAGLGGVEAEGEDIRAHLLDRQELMARIDRNEIAHGPLIISAYWLDRHLARVRAAVEPGPGGA